MGSQTPMSTKKELELGSLKPCISFLWFLHYDCGESWAKPSHLRHWYFDLHSYMHVHARAAEGMCSDTCKFVIANTAPKQSTNVTLSRVLTSIVCWRRRISTISISPASAASARGVTSSYIEKTVNDTVYGNNEICKTQHHIIIFVLTYKYLKKQAIWAL